ncbi:hypothetical protein CEXT_10931 [Caerostris extrusa]|uniref:Uncharacterized protein n=1 Tax=Caerostris extrusa TaxID=172846 RepID=A0AAV4NSH4_CAEEX|nr:hypothetical protein CEXT_10931 [Caerostris extrusa]
MSDGCPFFVGKLASRLHTLCKDGGDKSKDSGCAWTTKRLSLKLVYPRDVSRWNNTMTNPFFSFENLISRYDYAGIFCNTTSYIMVHIGNIWLSSSDAWHFCRISHASDI